MKTQIFFEDIEPGMNIPGFSFGPVTTEALARYGAAAGNFHPIHFDKDIARAQGLPDVLIHGPLKLALLDRMLRDWAGVQGRLLKISCSYQKMDPAGNTLTCHGKIIKKEQMEGAGWIYFETWTTNQMGDVTTRGTALLSVPNKPF